MGYQFTNKFLVNQISGCLLILLIENHEAFVCYW